MEGVPAAIAPQRRAQKIMGENFFGFEEAMKHFKVNPTDQDLKALAEIPFSEAVLEELKDTHILAAVFPLSILDILRANSNLFWDQSRYNDKSFAKEHGEASWQLVRKTPVPNSTSKNWWEKEELLTKADKVPTAQVMVYIIIGHYLATGERLFRNIRVWTSSLYSDGFRVYVGDFDSSGLDIDYCWDGIYEESVNLGVSSARKFRISKT